MPRAPVVTAGGAASPLLALDVHKAYGGRPVLRGFELNLEPGCILALLGPNGAGKTTFVSIVAGLVPADSGVVMVAGIEVKRAPLRAARRLSLASQATALYPVLSVERNLRVAAALAGLPGRQARLRARTVAAALGLDGLLSCRCAELSGGEQRLAHLATAFIAPKPLVILDEPTVGLDLAARERLLAAVRSAAGEGTAVCYLTHHLAEVEQLGAEVGIVHGGAVVARGSTDALVRRHAPPALELTFRGPAPNLPLPGTELRGHRLTILTDSPKTALADVVGRLGTHAERLASIEVLESSLESAYRRFVHEPAEAVEPVVSVDHG